MAPYLAAVIGVAPPAAAHLASTLTAGRASGVAAITSNATPKDAAIHVGPAPCRPSRIKRTRPARKTTAHPTSARNNSPSEKATAEFMVILRPIGPPEFRLRRRDVSMRVLRFLR